MGGGQKKRNAEWEDDENARCLVVAEAEADKEREEEEDEEESAEGKAIAWQVYWSIEIWWTGKPRDRSSTAVGSKRRSDSRNLVDGEAERSN
ncbi:hypothetical protein LINGRAPRIM_LOCUS2248 [Linum grandiflorum]